MRKVDIVRLENNNPYGVLMKKIGTLFMILCMSAVAWADAQNSPDATNRAQRHLAKLSRGSTTVEISGELCDPEMANLVTLSSVDDRTDYVYCLYVTVGDKNEYDRLVKSLQKNQTNLASDIFLVDGVFVTVRDLFANHTDPRMSGGN